MKYKNIILVILFFFLAVSSNLPRTSSCGMRQSLNCISCISFASGLKNEASFEVRGLLAQDEFILHVQGYPRPGGVLFVNLENVPSTEDIKVSCLWDKQKYNFFQTGIGYQVILPVKRYIKPATYNLKITVYSSGEEIKEINRKIKISPHWFGNQYLGLSKWQLESYYSKTAEIEGEKVDNAIMSFSKEQYFLGNFIWPVQGYISTSFGLNRYAQGEYYSWHKGLDIAAPEWKKVTAPAKGKVVLAEPKFTFYGKSVVLNHGQGLTTLYIHMASVKVKKGDIVKQGDLIGQVGQTGIATGPHLHWGAFIYGEPIDPRLLLTFPENWNH